MGKTCKSCLYWEKEVLYGKSDPCSNLMGSNIDPCSHYVRDLKNVVEKEDELLKGNLLNTVKYHKKHCDESCDVSLYLLKKLGDKAGLKFSDEEKKLFL